MVQSLLISGQLGESFVRQSEAARPLSEIDEAHLIRVSHPGQLPSGIKSMVRILFALIRLNNIERNNAGAPSILLVHGPDGASKELQPDVLIEALC